MLWLPLAHASVAGQQWVLQVGYFASQENALDFQQLLSEAGFELQTIAFGGGGERRYRVVSHETVEQSELVRLRDSVEKLTGTRGFITKSPFENITVESVFDQPTLSHYSAQATPTGSVNGSSARVGNYDPMLTSTPQEEIVDSHGFTTAKLQIVPTLGLSVGYDDNVTLAPEFEISSWFYMVSPAVRVEMPSNNSVFSVTGAIDIVRYQDSPIDDYEYWYLRGQWDWDISTRQYLSLFGQYSEGVDRRGEGRRQGYLGLIPLEPDAWELWDIGGEWDYGAIGARGRLTLEAGASDLTYTNNRGIPGVSLGTRALDRDWRFYGGTFYWRVAPKSSLLLDYRYTDIGYKLTDDADSVEHRWMAGVTWDATARTSGTVKYGYLTKEFDDPERSDYEGPTWQASIDWRPRTYSVFTLAGMLQTQEPDLRGDYLLRQDITLSWVHSWATRFGTSVDVGFGQDEYRPQQRTDDLFYWGAAAHYTFNTYFRFGASIRSYNRDSIEPRYDYDNVVYMLSLEATL